MLHLLDDWWVVPTHSTFSMLRLSLSLCVALPQLHLPATSYCVIWMCHDWLSHSTRGFSSFFTSLVALLLPDVRGCLSFDCTSAPDWGSDVSSRSPHCFYWEMMFQDHSLGCSTAHCSCSGQPRFLFSSADRTRTCKQVHTDTETHNANLESQMSTRSLFTFITSHRLKILWLFQNFCLLWETKVCINFNAKIRVEHNRMWVLPWMTGNIDRNNTWRQNSCNCWCFQLRSGYFQIVMDSVFSVKGEGKVFEYDGSAWCCQRFKSSGKTPNPCFMGKSTLGEQH